jgi:hypothetical protein
MLANPSAKFTRPRVHSSTLAHLKQKSYENRAVAIVSASEACGMRTSDALQLRNGGKGYTFWTRSRVVDLVARGEMRWIDRHHNGATFTAEGAVTWQKTRSGTVHTMQMKSGLKGRHVPFGQLDPEQMALQEGAA